MADITMRRLLKAGVHFGHQTRYWSPSMAPYIFGDRNKIHIVNLEKTLPMMQEAMNYLGTVTAQGGKILFVGTKRQAGKIIREEATRCGSPYVDHRWLGGMLTNYKTVKNSISRLKELEQRVESGATAGLSKKETLTLERERAKLNKTLCGIKEMGGLPDALFIIDVEQEYIAVAEANKLHIPVIAVVDTNCSVQGVDYIIPGNDDSTRAIRLYLESAADAILAARTVARSVAGVGDGDYVEINEAGEIIESDEPTEAAEASQEIAAEQPVESAEPSGSIAQSGAETAAETADDTETSAKTVAKKKVSKKKVTKKKVSKKKVVRKKPTDDSV